jgi:hypothetical protein
LRHVIGLSYGCEAKYYTRHVEPYFEEHSYLKRCCHGISINHAHKSAQNASVQCSFMYLPTTVPYLRFFPLQFYYNPSEKHHSQLHISHIALSTETPPPWVSTVRPLPRSFRSLRSARELSLLISFRRILVSSHSLGIPWFL